MLLRGLRIENFRAIRNSTISFGEGTALIGENDCGISSVLDALELVLGFDEKNKVFPPWLFHRQSETQDPVGPIRVQLRFIERHEGEWTGEEYEPFQFLLPVRAKRLREIWCEATIEPGDQDGATARYRLRSPGSKVRASDAKLIGRFRRMNPVIRVSAGMLTGRGDSPLKQVQESTSGLKVSREIQRLADRINKAVDSRVSGTSLNLKNDLDDGFEAASELMQLGNFNLGKWESGLTRSVAEILGWQPGRDQAANSTPFQDPNTAPERLGVLLLIGALLRARPGGMAPDADPLWIIEEPEAHLHPITLTSVAMFVGLIQRQKIITTYSGDLLSMTPLSQVRRLVRHNGMLHERRVRENTLSRSEMRRFHYHLRTRFSVATFARFWLLVEGESEYWILPQIARLMGYDFALEGIACIEFAQCGLEPPIKAARDLGIEWHLLTDGDPAGQSYAGVARQFLENGNEAERLTVLGEKDIERCFWANGYDDVFKKYSRMKPRRLEHTSPGKVIQAAVRKHSKPFLALSVVEAIATQGSPGIPLVLERMIDSCVKLARQSPERLARS